MSSRNDVHLSDGEKLIIAIIADQQKDPKNQEINLNEIMDAIYGGHFWALKWEYGSIFHDHVDSHDALSLVVDTLDMWSFIEEAVESFTESERKKLADELGILGEEPKFFGFDGNNESEHFGIASHLIHKMGRFQRFKNRDLNSHCPVVDRYTTMIQKFNPIRDEIGKRDPMRLTLDEVIHLLQP